MSQYKKLNPLSWIFLLMVCLGLTGCPDDDDGITQGTTTTTTSGGVVTNRATNNIRVDASSISLPSDGNSQIRITATLTNANNNVLEGEVIEFVSDAGEVVPLIVEDGRVRGETNAFGKAEALLSAAGAGANRTITVTARQRLAPTAVTATIEISLTGTTLDVVGPDTVVVGTEAQFEVRIANSVGAGIRDQLLSVTSALGNTITFATPSQLTNVFGVAGFTLNGAIEGQDILTLNLGGFTREVPVTIGGDSFFILSPAIDTEIPVGQSQIINLRWLRAGVPVVGQNVFFSATRGTFSSGGQTVNAVRTDATGLASVAISSTVAGPSVITADSGNATGPSTSIGYEFIASGTGLNPSLQVQASPTSVSVTGQSTITAIVRDSNGNLVTNERVQFMLLTAGGTLGNSVTFTDNRGIAQTSFFAGSSSSGQDGVRVRVLLPNAPNFATRDVLLTVVDNAAAISIGTNGIVAETADQQLYELPFSVLVTDGNGNPINGAQVNYQLTALQYLKGTWVFADGVNNSMDRYQLQASVTCTAEDLNADNVLQSGEDTNSNGRLDPSASAVTLDRAFGTTAGGSAQVTLRYTPDQAEAVRLRLVATTMVSGTEFQGITEITLPQVIANAQNPQFAPGVTRTVNGQAQQISPYGAGNSCADTL